jgi:post-segregation antitoxin (ccd killing protein)
MTRVNITVPDDVANEARRAGLNVSRVATAALVEELDRRRRIDQLDAYLTELAAELGPIPAAERTAAADWADQVLDPSGHRAGHNKRRSA